MPALIFERYDWNVFLPPFALEVQNADDTAYSSERFPNLIACKGFDCDLIYLKHFVLFPCVTRCENLRVSAHRER